MNENSSLVSYWYEIHEVEIMFDIICNDPDLPLADIVLFGFSLSGFPSWL